MFAGLMTSLNPDWKKDARLRLQFEDSMRLKDGDKLAIGKLWKQKYTEKYGEAPSLHDRFVNGAVRKVCSYTERDRPMGESVIRDYFSTHQERLKR